MIKNLDQNIVLKKDKIDEKLEVLRKLYKEKNEVMNLSTIVDDEEINIKHFLDSLYGSKYIKEGNLIYDVGSGGGFPAIPLALDNETNKFILIESTSKKCNYLLELKESLNLNIDVLAERAEDIGKNIKYREKADVVTARAVARLNSLCEYTLPLVKVGGIFIAYKGAEFNEELNEAKNAINILGGKVEKVEEYELPSGAGKRALIIIKKIKNTPEKYPRGNGKERKQPL